MFFGCKVTAFCEFFIRERNDKLFFRANFHFATPPYLYRIKKNPMKKLALILCLTVASFCSFAQEPGNNLGKSLYQIRQDFPNAVNSGPAEGGGDLWINLDEDQYHKYTYYFVIKNGRVDTETLAVSSTGVIPHAEYFFFLNTVTSFYTRKGWQFCDVDASILRAASIFNSEYRLVWADKFTAELDYSNFLIYFQYKPDSKVTYMSYFKR